jgi:hypothetical protein
MEWAETVKQIKSNGVNIFYEDSWGIVINADCRDILPELSKVDLVLTDPPYNGGLDYGTSTNDNRSWEEYTNWLNGILLQSEIISRGPVMCFLSKPAMIEMIKVRQPWWIGIWNGGSGNPAGPNNGVMFSPNYEPCLFYGNRYGVKVCIPDVWNYNVEKNRNGHPCPKPVGLMSRLIHLMQADTVLDPFLGSGTTAVAAKKLNRHYIGIEISEKYCEIAARRLSQDVMVLDIPDVQSPGV